MAGDTISLKLGRKERKLLQYGVRFWAGPARISHPLAVSMGFTDLDGFFAGMKVIGDALADEQPMSRTQWTQALMSTELVFVSAVVGAAPEWPIITDLSDRRTLELLRSVQSKLLRKAAIDDVAYRDAVTKAWWDNARSG